MVCRLRFILLVLFNSLLAGSVLADVALFSDAPDELIEKAKKDNYEHIIRELYFAKKHKYVVLNQDAFFQQDNLIIDLFNGGSITFEFEKIEGSDSSVTWYGKHPATKTFLYEKYGINDSNEEQWNDVFIQGLNNQSNIKIYSGLYNVVRDEKGEVTYESPYTYDSFIRVKTKGGSYLTEETLRTTSFAFHDVINGEKYRIQKLPKTPNILLLMEYDRSKLLPFIMLDFGHLTYEQQQQFNEHKQKFDTYLESHGIKEPKPMTKKEKRDWFYNVNKEAILQAPTSEIRQHQLRRLANFEDKYPKEVKKLLKEFGDKKN